MAEKTEKRNEGWYSCCSGLGNIFIFLFLPVIVLCNVFTPTRKALDFKHASQQRVVHKYMKEDEDTYMAVVESIRLMAQIQLL